MQARQPIQIRHVLNFVGRSILAITIIRSSTLSVQCSTDSNPSTLESIINVDSSQILDSATSWSLAPTPTHLADDPVNKEDPITVQIDIPPSNPYDPIERSAQDTFQEVLEEAMDDPDDDFEAFLQDLFEGDEELEEEEDSDVPPSSPPPRRPPTEEEMAEHKRQLVIETAEKRKDITTRHAKWEAELEAKGNAEARTLTEALTRIRAELVDDIKSNQNILDAVASVETEGLKILRGTDAYLEKLEESTGLSETQQADMWKSVVGKIEKRFNDKMAQVENLLQEYYNEHQKKEASLIDAAISELEDLADSAQTDLGMDYAWLDDVTTDDWTRYHDLKRTAKRFANVYQQIWDGKDPEQTENQAVIELLKIKDSLVDISEGFQHGVGKASRRAYKWLSENGSQEETGENPTNSGNGKEEEISEREVPKHVEL